METNPYAPPLADLSGPGKALEVETIRKAHLNAEGNLQSIGGIYVLGAALLLAALVNIVLKWDAANPPSGFLIAVLFVGALVHGTVGLALFQLKAGARWPSTVLALLGLVGFPIGTAIGFYILYQVHNRWGRFILSPEYMAIRAETRHLDAKTNGFRLLLLGVLLVFLLCTFLFLQLS